ncbi:type II toxin-antitoxin system HicA family toxin [Flavitalea sp.]
MSLLLIDDSKQLIKQVKAIGCVFDRQNGSHKIFVHPKKLNHLSIPDHGTKDLGKGLLHDLLKQAGLK